MIAHQVVQDEIDALIQMKERINGEFSTAVNMILACEGRLIITGMGKSGHVGQKIAATMASTGTPSFFVHPAESVHGDLGRITKEDVVLAISNSGETEEVLRLLPAIKRMGSKLISMCGRPESTLSRAGDIYLDVSVPKEACTLGLAPTSSTTAALVMGDALAVALLNEKGFKAEDFALCHPSGALGKRLLLRVEDIMHKEAAIPLAPQECSVQNALFTITEKKLGVVGVVKKDKELVGVFTDGDLRRLLLNEGPECLNKVLAEVMSANPKRILASTMAAKSMQKMKEYHITSLFVFENDESISPLGIIHIHDLINSGFD
ncbi:D-arabinose 5-phosphate isomerase [Syntrophotalea acetylenivorans]|uniref:D-arabinose 5-phosphate isomerase n=1 Tax=Syntrophotalea acetylenivorans TaxID=1842532 RepID=A0A1L3GSP2_9BACT|nr:KpsF/GutQ family sugar-phosphate isomerase [Syntrophotalea acetylenivorans]APG28942.1 D-arabinose 5-phosphate isomerase [Syntrophotalea acetylenivorans]